MRRHPDFPRNMSFEEISAAAKKLPPGTYCFGCDGNWARTRMISECPELEVGLPQFTCAEEERMELGEVKLGTEGYGFNLSIAGLYVKGGEHEAPRYDYDENNNRIS